MNKKYLFSTLCVATMCTLMTFITSNTTIVYANQIDAPVAVATTAPTQDVLTGSSARKAPVSIAIYSNVITESADTYDYSNKVTPTAEATTLPAVQTIAPIDTAVVPTDSATTVAPTTPETSAPQGTGSPDATPEPDMLTYPPTVAPAYTD